MKNSLVLLCNSQIIPSGRILRDSLQELLNQRIIINPRRIRNDNIILRYGSTVPIPTGIESNYNSIESIFVCRNKLLFSKLMENNNIFSPTYSKETPTEFPILIRETLTGHGGIGIHIIRNLEEFNRVWNPRFYWTKYEFLQSEYRIHIFNGEILRIFKKELEEISDFPIRNNHSCHFSLKNPDQFPKLKTKIDEFAKIKEFSQGFFGLDVGWNRENFFFIEANSAPGLNETSGSLLAEKIYDNIYSQKLSS